MSDPQTRLRELAQTIQDWCDDDSNDCVQPIEFICETIQPAIAELIELFAAAPLPREEPQPAPVVCDCGHLASEHGSPKPTACIVRGCGCKKNRAMVENTGVQQQGDDAEIVRAITAIVREADWTFQRVGGSSRHWVRDCFLPFLNHEGWIVSRAAAALREEPAPHD